MQQRLVAGGALLEHAFTGHRGLVTASQQGR
jgi:hypothetical protein